MVHGQLEVQAVGARNLKSVQTLGKMDPYMTLRIDTTKLRTRTLKNAHREPSWNETFKFNIIDNQTLLNIEIFNDDVGTDSMIGCTVIDLSKAFKEGVHDSFFPITNAKGQQMGEIRLVIYFRPLALPNGQNLAGQPIVQHVLPVQPVQQQPQPTYIIASSPPPHQPQVIFAQPPQQLPVFNGNPQQGYPPQQGYAPPPQGYPLPPQGYAPPPQGYSLPPQGYAPPQQGYPLPPQGYAPPPQGYPPSQGYAPPSQGYAPPPQGYPPQSGYAAPGYPGYR